jgi:hypothetical protein
MKKKFRSISMTLNCPTNETTEESMKSWVNRCLQENLRVPVGTRLTFTDKGTNQFGQRFYGIEMYIRINKKSTGYHFKKINSRYRVFGEKTRPDYKQIIDHIGNP